MPSLCPCWTGADDTAPGVLLDGGPKAVDARIDDELARGQSAKTVAQRVAAWSGRPRREIYERVISAKSRSNPEPE